MANKPSDWLLYGGLAVGNASAALGLVGQAGLLASLAWLIGLSGAAVAIGAVMKLADK